VDNPARAGALRWRFRKRASAHLRSRETPTKRGLGPATEERPLIDGRHLGCGALLSSSRRFSGERPCIRPRVAQARRGRAPRLHASHEVRGSVTRSWKTASLRQGSAGSVDPRRARNASRGAIRRRRSGLATRGVRADRVGVEFPGAARGNASAARGARIDESRPPLARETSAGSRSHTSDERKLAWKRVRPSRGAVSACDRAAHLPRQVGMRRSRGGARGLCWLQKSTSDARSKVERPRV